MIKDPILYSLIAKYLTGESSLDEHRIIDDWRKESARHERLFQELRESWQMIGDASMIVIPDRERVWNKIVTQIKRMPVMYSRQTLFRAASAAASVALIIGFSLSLLYNKYGDMAQKDIIVQTPAGEKSKIYLPDGTQVYLNSASTIIYNTGFDVKNRDIRLQGEACFEVAKNEQLPFNVKAADINVKAIGTSFNINAYPDEKRIFVSLAEGHVHVESAGEKELLADLYPNQQAVICKSNMKCIVQTCNAETESIWRLGRLRIENENIRDVLHKMERWYGVNIQTQGEPPKENIWMTVKTESLKEMLELINKITPVEYSIKGGEITITYK
ncbi:MAG: FecR domain-containing protein [Dysgonamonadaceae bacterium]|jgi:ferric-dicitrate binding protein FerR (iron transport regulator)|nr:FecR domain-containing protein [Dysgonamonadaceae bacterium]